MAKQVYVRKKKMTIDVWAQLHPAKGYHPVIGDREGYLTYSLT